MGPELTLILKVVGTVVSAIGQLQAGAAAQNAANFNAQVAANNARAVRLAAAEDAKRQKRLGIKRQGSRRALDPDKLDLLEDSAIEEELAVLSLLHAGEVQAVGFESTARLEIARGKAARTSSRFGAASTLLMGGAKAGGFGASAGAGGGTGSSMLVSSSSSGGGATYSRIPARSFPGGIY